MYKDGTKNTVTGQDNVVVRTYTGYNNIPGINSIYIEDVYAVGIRTNRNIGNTTPNYVYTADAVVVELNGKYQYQNTTSEQVFIPGATIVNNSVSRVAGQGWETVTMIRGNGEVQDVTVDLTVSKDYQTVNGYDPVDGRSRIAAGLYYMDPIDTNSSIYAIRRMDNADIRANNYLTGYVDSNTILANNWVQVEVMMQSQVKNPAGELKGVPAWSNLNVNGQPVGKRVDTENLYTLDGYTLTKAPAATVFEQWTGIHVNNNNAHPLNELYDVESNSFPLNLSNRNEILVRYSGDSVVWAVSFAELSGSDMNRAQTVWYNNLVANDSKVTSGVKFFGNADTDGDKNITINYADVVKGAPVINMAEIGAVSGVTVRDYTLTKWTDTLGYGENIPQNKEDSETADKYKTTGVKYKLVVNFVSGGFETYFLELLPQDPIGTLTSENDRLVRVIDAPDAAYKDSVDAAEAGADRVTVWVKDPQHINLNQLASLLQYKNGAKEGKVEVAYVENAAGTVETGYNTSIDDVITFVHDEQSAGKIILKVTNYDGLERFVQLKLTTGTANNLPGAKIAAKEAVDSYVDYYLNKVGLNRDILNANMGNPPEIMSGNPATWKAIDKIEWLKENFIEKATTVAEAESYMEDNGPNASPRWTETYIDLSASEAHAALKSNTKITGVQPIKALISDWIDEIKTANTNLENAKTAAISELNQLANQYQGTAQGATARAAADEGIAAIKAATDAVGVTRAKDAALKAIRDIVTPNVTPANKDAVKDEIAGDTNNAAYAGIENALWYPVVEQDATNRSVLKITGTVGTAAMSNASEWSNEGLKALFGEWSAAKNDVDSKFHETNTKIAVIAFFVGDELQIITIGDKNVEYAKAHTNGLITVGYPNFPNADVITLDVNNVTF